MIRLGKRGYRAIMMNLTRTADYLSKNLVNLGFLIMSKGAGDGLPLVAFRLDPKSKKLYDEFQIAHQLRERGWVVPAYTMVRQYSFLTTIKLTHTPHRLHTPNSSSSCVSLSVKTSARVDAMPSSATSSWP